MPLVLIFLLCALIIASVSFVRPIVMSVANTHLKNTASKVINGAVLKNFENGNPVPFR